MKYYFGIFVANKNISRVKNSTTSQQIKIFLFVTTLRIKVFEKNCSSVNGCVCVFLQPPLEVCLHIRFPLPHLDIPR